MPSPCPVKPFQRVLLIAVITRYAFPVGEAARDRSVIETEAASMAAAQAR